MASARGWAARAQVSGQQWLLPRHTKAFLRASLERTRLVWFPCFRSHHWLVSVVFTEAYIRAEAPTHVVGTAVWTEKDCSQRLYRIPWEKHFRVTCQNVPKGGHRRKMRGQVRLGLKCLKREGSCQHLELKRSQTEPPSTFCRRVRTAGSLQGRCSFLIPWF